MSMEPSLRGTNALMKETPESPLELFPPCENTIGSGQSASQSTALRRTLPGWHSGSWNSSPQNCQREISTVHEPPNLRPLLRQPELTETQGHSCSSLGISELKYTPHTPVSCLEDLFLFQNCSIWKEITERRVTQLSSLRLRRGRVFPRDRGVS